MILVQYYINQNVKLALDDTGLAADELEAIVGRYAPHSQRRGQLRGKVEVLACGSVRIKNFSGKVLWTNEC